MTPRTVPVLVLALGPLFVPAAGEAQPSGAIGAGAKRADRVIQ